MTPWPAQRHGAWFPIQDQEYRPYEFIDIRMVHEAEKRNRSLLEAYCSASTMDLLRGARLRNSISGLLADTTFVSAFPGLGRFVLFRTRLLSCSAEIGA